MMSAELATIITVVGEFTEEKIVGGLFGPTPILNRVRNKFMFLI